MIATEVLFFIWQICVGLALVIYGIEQHANLKRMRELEERMAEVETGQKAQEQR